MKNAIFDQSDFLKYFLSNNVFCEFIQLACNWKLYTNLQQTLLDPKNRLVRI